MGPQRGTAPDRIATDAGLSRRLGGTTPHSLLGGDTIAVTAAEKHHLWTTTGAAAIDLESGAVARAAAAHGLPFAVLRAVCDPAGRNLPPAALTALNNQGAIGLLRILGSLLRRPGQLPGLMELAADAAAARRALTARVTEIGQLSTST
jgi:adenosylhomocysteine nucleosidase